MRCPHCGIEAGNPHRIQCPVVLADAEVQAAGDKYYVCDQCGHYWSSPEHPERCENCRAAGSFLMERDTLAQAEETSETVLTTER